MKALFDCNVFKLYITIYLQTKNFSLTLLLLTQIKICVHKSKWIDICLLPQVFQKFKDGLDLSLYSNLKGEIDWTFHQISQYVGGSCIRLWLRDVYFGLKWCLHLVKQVLETCILKPWKSAYKVCNLEILQILDYSSLGSYIYKERERDFMK